jgi:ABC-2 type transport system ATP-binding protein
MRRTLPDHSPDPAPASLEQAVWTDGLTKVYPTGTTAVDRLDLAVRGEILGLLGPNGAGKSTTAGMLTTRVLPTAGRAWVADIDVVARPALARKFIGVVPQHNTLDRSLSVRENLVFHGRFFGMSAGDAAAVTEALLERVALGHVRGQPVDTLSGGMAQRLMIARAVMHRPAVLFLDEPTAGLDPQSRLAVHELVRELHAAGQTILLITHDMEEADKLSERIAIIDHGRLLALDTPAELKRSVHADTVVKVASDTAAARRSVTLRDVRVEEPTLETVFIGLTGKELRD